MLPELLLPPTAAALRGGRRVAIHTKEHSALTARSREHKARRAVALHGRLVNDAAGQCSLDKTHHLGTVAENAEGILEAELPKTGLDGLFGGVAFINAGDLDTLTKHGAADKEQLVGAIECAGPPTNVPRHDASKRAWVGRLRCRGDVGM
jgi:hypothetical protein